jgi:hypothetical protein
MMGNHFILLSTKTRYSGFVHEGCDLLMTTIHCHLRGTIPYMVLLALS